MGVNDQVNAAILFAAGIMQWVNVRRLYRDRCVRGVSLWTQAFYCGWGLWNCYYLPGLGQTWSAVANAVIMGANFTWLQAAWRFRPRHPGQLPN